MQSKFKESLIVFVKHQYLIELIYVSVSDSKIQKIDKRKRRIFRYATTLHWDQKM